MHVSLSKVEHDLSNKVVQKFTLEKHIFDKSPKLKKKKIYDIKN